MSPTSLVSSDGSDSPRGGTDIDAGVAPSFVCNISTLSCYIVSLKSHEKNRSILSEYK